MIYCFDIDGVICTTKDMGYSHAKPDRKVINLVNKLAEEGHTIILHTARGSVTGKDWQELTQRQLKQWRVRYSKLYMGKPAADFYVDDKAVHISTLLLLSR